MNYPKERVRDYELQKTAHIIYHAKLKEQNFKTPDKHTDTRSESIPGKTEGVMNNAVYTVNYFVISINISKRNY